MSSLRTAVSRELSLDTNEFFDVIHGSTVRTVDDKVMSFLKAEGTGMEVFPMVNNFDGQTGSAVLADFLMMPAPALVFAGRWAAFLANDKYHGLMVDFETFPRNAQPGYLALLKELAGDLHSNGMKLYVSVQARNEDYDYAAVAARVDGVVLMNYDEHYPGGTPGPVATQDWFTDNLAAAIKKVPREKLICAIGNYGYDWVHKPKRGALPAGVKDTNVSVQQAWLTARDSEAEVDFDGDALNPHISYEDEHNLQHDIWFSRCGHRIERDACRTRPRH